MAVGVKICGLKTEEMLRAAIEAGADQIGFVFFPKSPRNVSVETAAGLAPVARGKVEIVALVVDADDALIDAIAAQVAPDLFQLHGSETPERAAAIRTRTGIPVMKVIKIADAADLAPVSRFAPVVDRFLFETKPPADLKGALPGGNGVTFDWRLIRGLDPGRPYMLSGGLDAENVATAIATAQAPAVDVSSGVERAPGEKDPDKIRAFIRAAREAVVPA